jgi:hypothetical protein
MERSTEEQAIKSEGPSEHSTRARWLLWIVGGLSLAWNAMGALDYTMSQTHNELWLAAATAAQRAYIDAFPAWEVAFWALGVWGAVVGSLLLLGRSKHAVAAFAVSLAGLAVTSAYQWWIAPPPVVHSAAEVAFTIALWIVAVGLLWCALAMRTSGALR